MALAEMFLKPDNSYVMRATARLYLTAGAALVTENDPAGRTLWRDIGAEISMTDAFTYGLAPRSFILPVGVQCGIASFGPGDATGDVVLTIPGNSLVIGAYAICIEAAGGTIRPSIDWGEVRGDADGIFDGLGEAGICDTRYAQVGSKAEDVGLGALIIGMGNDEDIKGKATRFSMSEQIFQNTKTVAGTGTVTGGWLVCMLYVTLPSFLGIGA